MPRLVLVDYHSKTDPIRVLFWQDEKAARALRVLDDSLRCTGSLRHHCGGADSVPNDVSRHAYISLTLQRAEPYNFYYAPFRLFLLMTRVAMVCVFIFDELLLFEDCGFLLRVRLLPNNLLLQCVLHLELLRLEYEFGKVDMLSFDHSTFLRVMLQAQRRAPQEPETTLIVTFEVHHHSVNNLGVVSHVREMAGNIVRRDFHVPRQML